MKIFIAGARSLTVLNNEVKTRLHSIYENNYEILVGDCYGVDSAVQEYYRSLNYGRVTVYASNGIARNNLGKWAVQNVRVDGNVRGFDFYKQKDIAMANSADYGFMIWDGESRGTLNNIINLLQQRKKVLTYISQYDKMIVLNSFESLDKLLLLCSTDTQATYRKLRKDDKKTFEEIHQISLL